MNATRLAYELRDQRAAFGYIYRRGDYSPAFARIAPWATGDMSVSAPNITLACLREVSRYMPAHDAARQLKGEQ